MLGLLEKKRGIYYHSITGSTLYKQIREEIAHISKHQKELKMIGFLERTGQFSQNEIRALVEQVTYSNNYFSMYGGVTISNSYEEMIKLLRERIELATDEILLAAKISEIEIIFSLMNSIRRRVKVRILVDEKSIAEYRRLYYGHRRKAGHLARIDKHEEERIKVVENPWYQTGVEIERRAGEVPFGVIILDRREVVIQSVGSYNPNMIVGGLLVKGNRRISDSMLRLYEQMWDNSHPI